MTESSSRAVKPATAESRRRDDGGGGSDAAGDDLLGVFYLDAPSPPPSRCWMRILERGCRLGSPGCIGIGLLTIQWASPGIVDTDAILVNRN